MALSPLDADFGTLHLSESLPNLATFTNEPVDEDVQALPAIPSTLEYATLAGRAKENGPVEIKRTYSDNAVSALTSRTLITVNEQDVGSRLLRQSSRGMKNKSKDKDRSDAVSTKSTKSVSSRIFSRKSWLPSSRPSSRPGSRPSSPPKPAEPPALPQDALKRISVQSITKPAPAARRLSPRPSAQDLTEDALLQRRISPSIDPGSRTTSENSFDIDSNGTSIRPSRKSSFSSLRSKASLDRMYLHVPGKHPPMPSSLSTHRLSQPQTKENKQKDPQWTAFRAVDGEHTTFLTKTSPQRAKAVRTALLPFLMKSHDNAAVKSLRAEDLDRRAFILNKWWSTLLDAINSNGQSAISGTDRAVYFEAICEIMFRPEWKVPTLLSTADSLDSKHNSLTKSESATSEGTEDCEVSMSSVHQSVQAMFLQNLTRQMKFAVEKLSMRNVPASLSIFGGKTCAYAYVYCPGVADILSSLWHIPTGTLGRLVNEYGDVVIGSTVKAVPEISMKFPAALRSLCYTSRTKLSGRLASRMPDPPNFENVRWRGSWLNRWRGRDSDLFFVFVKYFHVLIKSYLSRPLSLSERLAIPGLIVVHAQILLTLEATLNRQAHHVANEAYQGVNDDGADAIAPSPIVINNATRSMGENRLVILLRDIVADKRAEHEGISELLIVCFQYLLKAATKKISVYHNDACFVLCDFLEELLPIVARAQLTETGELHWRFWHDVFQRLLQSQTTMTQIRVIAFLYSTWHVLMPNETRKRAIVYDWLLAPEVFNTYFNHWSPMVRHYFLRLVCWRIARSDGSPTATDLDIYKRLTSNLTACWARHQYMVADAEMRNVLPPPTTTCSPAPGRVLLIIRTDGHKSNGDQFTSFDKLIPSSVLSFSNSSSTASRTSSTDSQQPTPKSGKWSLLKTIGLFSSPTNDRPGEVTPPRTPPGVDRDMNNKQTSNPRAARSRPPSPPPQPLTFRFSLEYANTRPTALTHAHLQRRLPAPVLPHTSQRHIDDILALDAANLSTTTGQLPARALKKEPKPLKPSGLAEERGARYSGRALAEWGQIVTECKNFYIRRKQEGVSREADVEVPAMAVEAFRMFG